MRETGMGMKSCLICLMSSLGVQAAAPPTVWDFENGSEGWKPRGATVKVERVTGLGATTDSRACLHVHGRMEENWNYALSDSVLLQAGQLFRPSAWVKGAPPGS